MHWLRWAFVSLACLIGGSPAAAGEERPGALADLRIASGKGAIAEAWFADPTTRYRHFVLGSRYEAGSLVVRLRDGSMRRLTLPESSVFEDRQPRLADLDGDGTDEIVVVQSYLDRGTALAVLALRNDKLEIIAETPPTGRAHTWLNPAGIADFDGDGRIDIAYVQMPHALGLLRVWTLRDRKLVEIAQVRDTSNHVAGSPHLGMSAVADFDGDGVADLAVPSFDRRSLRVLTFKGGVRELSRHALPAQAVGDLSLTSENGGSSVIVGLAGGQRFSVRPSVR
jgi:hypothetical protein